MEMLEESAARQRAMSIASILTNTMEGICAFYLTGSSLKFCSLHVQRNYLHNFLCKSKTGHVESLNIRYKRLLSISKVIYTI